MALTASKLRQDVYRILDQVLETGVPVEVERRGQLLRIVLVTTRNKLDNLTERPDFLRGDPEEIVHLDWSEEWHP